MNTTIQNWYNFILQQMAAESYLGSWNNLDDAQRQNLLWLGSNNSNRYPNGDPTLFPNLPGATRMTESQAADFLNRYTVVSHLPNTASGFSATLMKDNVTGAYTLSMRSTEYFKTKGVSIQ